MSTYQTIERWEASYLLSQGVPLLEASLHGDRRFVTFLFDDAQGVVSDHLLVFTNDSRLQEFVQASEQVAKLIKRARSRAVDAERRRP